MKGKRSGGKNGNKAWLDQEVLGEETTEPGSNPRQTRAEGQTADPPAPAPICSCDWNGVSQSVIESVSEDINHHRSALALYSSSCLAPGTPGEG